MYAFIFFNEFYINFVSLVSILVTHINLTLKLLETSNRISGLCTVKNHLDALKIYPIFM